MSSSDGSLSPDTSTLSEYERDRVQRYRDAPEWYRNSMLGILEFGALPPQLPEDHEESDNIPTVAEHVEQAAIEQHLQRVEARRRATALEANSVNLASQAHRLPALLQTLARAMADIKQNDPTVFAAFLRHAEHTKTATQCLTRRWAIWLWFGSGLPAGFTAALKQVAEWYSTDASLRLELAELENDDQRLDPEQRFHARRHGLAAYGWDHDERGGAFEDISAATSESVEALPARLEAAFEIRKVRILYASQEERSPSAEGERSVDVYMVEWIRRVRQQLENIINWNSGDETFSAEQHTAAKRAGEILGGMGEFAEELRGRQAS